MAGGLSFSSQKAVTKDVKQLERKVINVEERINNLLHAITNLGASSHSGFRSEFWTKLETERVTLRGIEKRWKQLVDKAVEYHMLGKIPETLHYRVLANNTQIEYENYLYHVAAESLSVLGRIPDMKIWKKRLNEAIIKERKLAAHERRDIAYMR